MTFIIVSALVGGWLYWWRGHSSPRKYLFPRPFNQAAFALPYALMAFFWSSLHWPLDQLIVWYFQHQPGGPLGIFLAHFFDPEVIRLTVFFAVWGGTTAAVCTGHGQYFLGMAIKYIKPERLDFILRPIYGDDPRTDPRLDKYPENDPIIQGEVIHYSGARLKMRCIAGMGVTGMAITIPAGIITLNPLLAISGVLKGAAYVISDKAGFGTPGGEFLTGLFLWGYLATFANQILFG